MVPTELPGGSLGAGIEALALLLKFAYGTVAHDLGSISPYIRAWTTSLGRFTWNGLRTFAHYLIPSKLRTFAPTLRKPLA